MSTILLAEDDEYITEVVRHVLDLAGYTVTATPDGKEALAAFVQTAPDLIIADVVMPQMDGFALLQAVRAHPEGAAVPFLFLSARVEPDARARARQLGADDYIAKPFRAEELLQAVRAKLERRAAVRLFDTRSAHVQTVVMLANVIEARDHYTRGHIERVQLYALALARALDWNSEALIILEFGALLHDIGKIAVPSAILNKPAALTPAERKVMHRHPEVGARMLGGVDHLKAAIPYVACHHEQWDGHGYPGKLVGYDIPPEGRLLAIADTYDAMTSDRAYRAALRHAEAQAEIRRHAGKQFDPEMVEVFLGLQFADLMPGAAQ